MRRSDHPGQSPTVLDRLVASRARFDLKRGLEGASRVGLAAVGVLGVLKLGEFLAPVWPRLSFMSGGAALALSGAVLLLGLLATAVHVRRTRPSLLVVARRADRHFGLDERLSTALEFGMEEGPAPTASPVLAALFRDAAVRADQVNPRALVPLSIPRPAWYMVTVVVAVLALDLSRPLARPEAASAATMSASVAAEGAETIELVLETAALLRLEAERRQNEYLAVVATSLEKLALDVIEGRLGGDALAQTLARLVAHAELALRTDEAGPAVDLASATTPGTLAMRGDEGLDLGNGYRQPEEAGTTSTAQAGTALGEARSALENLRSRLADDPQGGERIAGAASPSQSRQSADSDADPSQLARSQADGGDGDRPLANLALDSEMPGEAGAGEGGSAVEGVGTGQFAASAAQTPLPEAASTRDFELPTEGGSRRRLPLEIVPETRFSSVEETPVSRGDWRYSAEERVTSDFLGISYRDVASRYFLSLTRDAVEEAP